MKAEVMTSKANTTPKPKKNPLGAKAGLISADMLIKDKSTKGPTIPDPSAAALEELRRICQYNDPIRVQAQRVSIPRVVQMLQSHGWTGSSKSALDSLCQRRLERTSFGTL